MIRLIITIDILEREKILSMGMAEVKHGDFWGAKFSLDEKKVIWF